MRREETVADKRDSLTQQPMPTILFSIIFCHRDWEAGFFSLQNSTAISDIEISTRQILTLLNLGVT